MVRAAEFMGTRANLQMAEYVHGFLSRTAKERYREFKRARPKGRRWERADFLNGVISGFNHKLEEQCKQNRQEGLVWVQDPQLQSFEECRHPRTRSRRTAPLTCGSAYAAGHCAGSQIVLHRPMAESQGQRGRLLAGES